MSTSRRRYTPEFKLEAVRLISDQGQRVKDVAESLGVHPGLLHQWRAAVRANGSNAFSADAPAKLESEEIRQLRRELKVAREERDILKKALGYFAKLKK